ATEEFEMLQRMEHEDFADMKVNKVTNPEDIVAMQKTVQKVHIEDALKKYIVTLVQRTRSDPRIDVGISPRGSIAVFKLAKAHAAFYGRDYVVPDDVKNVVLPALSHRLILKAEARIRGVKAEGIITEFLQGIPIPAVE
ncbi:MAG: MoxR family ATPase, partial [Euryarchaeota archaeon]|nr:MoxR family ATPase [Euryarchaeota archaeon]